MNSIKFFAFPILVLAIFGAVLAIVKLSITETNEYWDGIFLIGTVLFDIIISALMVRLLREKK